MASEKLNTLIDEIKVLSVIELSELVKALEEVFGVSAAAMAAPAGGAKWHFLQTGKRKAVVIATFERFFVPVPVRYFRQKHPQIFPNFL